jgi:hypothetical protein
VTVIVRLPALVEEYARFETRKSLERTPTGPDIRFRADKCGLDRLWSCISLITGHYSEMCVFWNEEG